MPLLSLNDQLLLFVADVLDFHRRFTRLSLVGAVSGDPRLYRHRRLMVRYLRHRRERARIQKALYGLKRRGYLQERVLGESRGYLVTPKGGLRLLTLRLVPDSALRRLPGGKWLMVFFDVPETLRRQRDQFRGVLKSLGFEQVQRSVWVTPYQVQAELRELIHLLNFQSYAKPLLVEEFPV